MNINGRKVLRNSWKKLFSRSSMSRCFDHIKFDAHSLILIEKNLYSSLDKKK